MQDPAFMVIRVGKHREKIRVADYKPEKWPAGHEILSGMPPIPAEIVKGGYVDTGINPPRGVAGPDEGIMPARVSQSDDLDALKVKADRMNIPYGANIGAPTLAKRIADAEGGAE
jgi:hypothetical protein